MNLILYLSEAVIPILVLLIVGTGSMYMRISWKGQKAESAQQ